MGLKVDNIFDLVGHFGATEDRLSASLGFLLKNNPRLFRAFLAELGMPADSPSNFSIVTQQHYGPLGQDIEENRIDLEMSKTLRFTCFLESKIRGSWFDRHQLTKYAKILEGRRALGERVRLVLVTQTDQRQAFQSFAQTSGLSDGECVYMRWDDVIRMVEQNPTRRLGKVQDLFARRLGMELRDVREMAEQPVKDVKEILVVTVNAENVSLALNEHIYRCALELKRADCRYIAFYETGGPKQIRYIARVRRTEIDIETNCKRWVFDGPPIHLARPVPKGKLPPQFTACYPTLDQFMNADTLDDIIRRRPKH